MPELKLPMCVMVAILGSPRWWFQTSSFKIQRSGRFEERCTAVLFGAVFVMTAYAPDCKKDLNVFETLIKNVTNIFWEGRRGEANDFYITGDFSVELGLLSAIWE